MTRGLEKRVERLEKATGGDLHVRLRAFAERFGVAPDRLIALADEHRERLAKEIDDDLLITWEGFCWLRDLGAFNKPNGIRSKSVA
jgi:hypothetical protein